MKKILAMICLGLTLSIGACVTVPTSEPADVNQTITNTLTSVGTVLSKVPATMDSLYASGLVTKEQYNKVADIYMKAKAAYILAVDAHEANLVIGSADSQAKYYIAFASFLKLNSDLQVLLLSFSGGK